jgi:hypothetical protein
MGLRERLKAFLIRRQQNLFEMSPIGVGVADNIINKDKYDALKETVDGANGIPKEN